VTTRSSASRAVLNQVRELADVARPRVVAKRGPGVGAQGLGREHIVGARVDEERFGKQDDVVTPLPERRQLDSQDGEAMIEGVEEALRDIPIIALSAHAMAGDEEKARQSGCDGYLTKPLDETRLFDMLAKFLAGPV
jgi:AmiR/NasT family two-component response regulator